MKPYTRDLRQRWSHSKRGLKGTHPVFRPNAQNQLEEMADGHTVQSAVDPIDPGMHADATETCPNLLQAIDIQRLLRDPNSHELDHLIRQATHHAASLRQMNRRLGELSAPVGLQENLGHSYALWKHRLDILSMVVEARRTLARNTEPEHTAVAAARAHLRRGRALVSGASTRQP